MKDLKSKIENYQAEFEKTEIGTPLILIAEVLVEIRDELKNITNKLYE